MHMGGCERSFLNIWSFYVKAMKSMESHKIGRGIGVNKILGKPK